MTQKTRKSCSYWSPLYPGKSVLKSKGGSIWISNIWKNLTTEITRMQTIILVLKHPKNMHIKFLSVSEVAAGKSHDFISNQGKAFAHWSGMTCRRPSRYVPYKGTFVPYDSTFGTSDQGQTLDVWQGEDSQIHHWIRQIRRFAISSVRKKSNQKRYRRIRISTTILDHTDRN